MKPINEDDEIRVLGGSNWQPSVERGGGSSKEKNGSFQHFFKYLKRGCLIFLLVLLCIGTGFYLYREHYVYHFKYPLSRTQSEVIASLQQARHDSVVGITASSDSVLGVFMKIYKIDGLKAELTFGVPCLNDENLYLVTRSSDYRYQNEEKLIIGDFIHLGEEIQHNAWRAGYFSIVKGRAEIGIGRRPDMRDYVLDNHGSMFRQFALVSAGIKCISQYKLKGKVTRCAYARMPNNDLYYVETKYPETLFGFSDALIEYGFVDVVYVTGGSQKNLYFRDVDGVSHGDYVDDKSHYMVVWKKHL